MAYQGPYPHEHQHQYGGPPQGPPHHGQGAPYPPAAYPPPQQGPPGHGYPGQGQQHHQTLQQMGAEQGPEQQQQGPFVVVKDKFLQINLGVPSSTGVQLSQVLIKLGSMVAYTGDIGFERQSLAEEGLGNVLKKALLTSDGVTLTKATLRGGLAQLFLADGGKNVTVLRLLPGDSIVVNGNDVLAFEPSVQNKIQRMKSVSSVVSGGFFSVKFKGPGLIAFLTHGKALTLTVAPGRPPVFTDPQATVAWSGDLNPDFHTDFHFRQLVGRGSGDSFQMQFSKGTGIVIVQPLEEVVPS